MLFAPFIEQLKANSLRAPRKIDLAPLSLFCQTGVKPWIFVVWNGLPSLKSPKVTEESYSALQESRCHLGEARCLNPSKRSAPLLTHSWWAISHQSSVISHQLSVSHCWLVTGNFCSDVNKISFQKSCWAFSLPHLEAESFYWLGTLA